MIQKETFSNFKEVSHLARVVLYFFLLILTVIYQIKNPYFIPLNFVVSVYVFLSLSLFINSIFLILRSKNVQVFEDSLQYLYVLDLVVITGLLSFAGMQASLYMFFYLYLIFLVSLTHKLRGAFLCASLASLLFSFILVIDKSVVTETKVILFVMNNISFFIVAYMSGSLSQRLDELGTTVKFQEKSISRLENINQLILDNVDSGLIATDGDFKIIQYNLKAESLLGTLKNDEIISNYIPELNQNSKVLQITRSLKNDLKYLDILVSKFEIEEKSFGAIILIQDVTDKKKLAEQQKTQEKLAAVGQLAAGIAHEIRNPLASMSGSIQLLASSFENLDSEQKKLIAITLKETDRLNALISEFLEFVRPQIPMNDDIHMEKVIKECVDMIKLSSNLVQPEFELNLELGIKLKGNRDKLKQAFLNILINACHALDATKNPKVFIHLEKQEIGFTVKFRDNGKGMDATVLNRIFEPFFTTKSKGTGLGLALVHKVLEMHGAKVEVESQLNMGTEFKMRFESSY